MSFTWWFCNPVPNCKNESNIGLNLTDWCQIEHQHKCFFFLSIFPKNSNAIKSEAMILWKWMSLMKIPGLGMRNPTMRKKDNKETHWYYTYIWMQCIILWDKILQALKQHKNTKISVGKTKVIFTCVFGSLFTLHPMSEDWILP